MPGVDPLTAIAVVGIFVLAMLLRFGVQRFDVISFPRAAFILLGVVVLVVAGVLCGRTGVLVVVTVSIVAIAVLLVLGRQRKPGNPD